MPAPPHPDPNTEEGRSQLKFSRLTCTQQIDSKIFAYMKRIRPCRTLVIDEQKGLVATFPCSFTTAHGAARLPECYKTWWQWRCSPSGEA